MAEAGELCGPCVVPGSVRAWKAGRLQFGRAEIAGIEQPEAEDLVLAQSADVTGGLTQSIGNGGRVKLGVARQKDSRSGRHEGYGVGCAGFPPGATDGGGREQADAGGSKIDMVAPLGIAITAPP